VSEPLRIGVVSQVPPPVHGQTVMTERFLDALRELGIAFCLVDRRFSASIGEVGRPSVRKVMAVFGLLARAASMTMRFRPTVTVLFMTTRPGSFLVDWAVAEVLRRTRRPVIYYVHSVGFQALAARKGIWAVAMRRIFHEHAQVVTLGETLEADVADVSVGLRRHLIANTPGSVPSPPAQAGRTVLFLSNLMRGKGAECFARIAGDVVADRPDWTFVLAGAHADPDVVADVRRELAVRDATDTVQLPGALDTAGKWSALSRAAVLVFTSELTEAQPLTIAEAFACGVPVAAFRTGGVPDLVEHGMNGLLADPGDEAALRRHVAELLEDTALRSRLAEGASRTYATRLSPDVYARAWRRVLQEAST